MKEDQIMREADGTEVPRSETAVWKHCLYWSRTWNVKRLRYWVEVASVLCMRGEADRKMLDVYIEDVRELAPCVEAALPVLGRGNVGIDFDNCTINIEKDIDLEPQAPGHKRGVQGGHGGRRAPGAGGRGHGREGLQGADDRRGPHRRHGSAGLLAGPGAEPGAEDLRGDVRVRLHSRPAAAEGLSWRWGLRRRTAGETEEVTRL